MNTGPLKTYAVQARKDFIQAVTDRAAQLGITKASIAPVQASSGSDKGVVVIGGAPFPSSVVPSRERVVTAIERDGFRAVIEQVAYTWFNRFVALRFMEVHGYLDHGLRVLSDPNGGAVPEAVARLRDLDLPTLDKSKAIELAMAGNQDEALYRLILLAQCHHLAKPMPWLFDTRLHDGVDLLLPGNLLATDSLVRGLVDGIPEDDWKQGVEIIGWLYQFFISERKDEVIGSVVAPEDIPAATQLFTPNWIVQYLVQNSVGRLWMESYPNSKLRQHMPYYIEQAPQDTEVQAELDKIAVHDRTPESLTVLDPACGSGHILVEAFRLLFQIYLERGYREREIPRLIFENNLFGLDIDDRAAQLACMTLLFEARRHDARIFTNPPHLQVLAIQQSREHDRAAIDASAFSAKAEAKSLINNFSDAKTIGSLLRLAEQTRSALPKIRAAMPANAPQQSYLADQITDVLRPLLELAEVFSRQFDAVVANPPYMGGKGMTKGLKEYAKEEYPRSKADAFAMFIERGFELVKDHGFNAMVTMQSWMFLSSYEEMREHLLKNRQVISMAHLGARAFGSISGEVVQTTMFSARNVVCPDHRPSFCRLTEGNEEEKRTALRAGVKRFVNAKQNDFAKIPGMPLAYWLSASVLNSFTANPLLGSKSVSAVGQNTGDNDRFIRRWWEVDINRINMKCKDAAETFTDAKKWYPYNKGGPFRKYFGNVTYVINWQNDAREIKEYAVERNGGKHWSRYIQNLDFLFREGLTWSDVTSGRLSVRYLPPGHISDVSGQAAFFNDRRTLLCAIALLNTTYAMEIAKALNPTLHFQAGNYRSIPIAETIICCEVEKLAVSAISISEWEWNSHETSMSYYGFFGTNHRGAKLTSAINESQGEYENKRRLAMEIEGRIEESLAKSYFNDPQDYKAGYSSNPLQQLGWIEAGSNRVDRLISYAMGCIMGRYSLDHQGIIYAHAGNIGFNPGLYLTLSADADGIVPLTDEAWFKDDATERFVEFVSRAWPADGLEENLAFVAKALGAKANESSRDSIRRYLADGFYKDHCQTYKKRPIYWLFSSGKQQAFQCLVYLHRYNADTLGRMRADYVIPLQGKLQGRLTALTEEVARAGSTAQRKQAQKALDLIDKKIRELATFDDQLRSYADKRIELDLDDGVKVNIRKFGTLIDLKPLGNLDSEE